MLTRVACFHREGNLSVVQLAASNQDSFQYTTCSNAIRSNLIEVKELNEAGYRTLEMLDGFEKVAREEHPSVAVGAYRRFESGEMTGFELVYGGHLIHLAALRGQNPMKMA